MMKTADAKPSKQNRLMITQTHARKSPPAELHMTMGKNPQCYKKSHLQQTLKSLMLSSDTTRWENPLCWANRSIASTWAPAPTAPSTTSTSPHWMEDVNACVYDGTSDACVKQSCRPKAQEHQNLLKAVAAGETWSILKLPEPKLANNKTGDQGVMHIKSSANWTDGSFSQP